MHRKNKASMRTLVRNGVVVADGSLIRAGDGMSYSPIPHHQPF